MQRKSASEEFMVAAGQGIDEIGRVETRGIDQIPEVERHSNPKNLAAAFISVQFSFVIVIFGALPIEWGLGWWPTVAVVTLGLAIGSLIIALMSLSGPRTGTNQSVSSGAYFGVWGRLIGSGLALFIDIAFLAIIAWTTGETFVDGFHRLAGTPTGNGSLAIGMAVACVLIILIGYLGHATLVASYKIWLVAGVVFQLAMVAIFAPHFHALAGANYVLGSFWPTWFLSLTVAVSIPLSYITWPNDYGRRMPRRTNPWSLGAWSGVSMFVGCWVALVLGAFICCSFSNIQAAFVDGAFAASPSWFIVVLMLYGFLGNSVNGGPGVYNSALDLQALLFRLPRNIVVLIIAAVVLVVAYVGVIVLNAINTLDGLVTILIVVVTPWAVINIVGMWLRHGHVYADELHAFAIRGARGPYWFTGGINYRAVGALVIGATIGLLFNSNTIFVGPFSGAVGGVDLSFSSAGVAGGLVYLILVALFPETGVTARGDAAETSASGSGMARPAPSPGGADN